MAKVKINRVNNLLNEDKAPNPNNFNFVFFPKYWVMVKEELLEVSCELFNDGIVN